MDAIATRRSIMEHGIRVDTAEPIVLAFFANLLVCARSDDFLDGTGLIRGLILFEIPVTFTVQAFTVRILVAPDDPIG